MKVRRKSDPSGEVLDLPTNEVAAGVLRGEFLVESGAQLPVRSSDGTVGHVPVENYLEAVRSKAFTPLTTEEVDTDRERRRAEREYGGAAGKAVATLTGGAAGISGGATDIAIGELAPEPVREYVRGSRRANPVTSAAANVGATVGTLLLARGKGGANAAKAPGMLSRALSATPAGLTARAGAATEGLLARAMAAPAGMPVSAARRAAQYMVPKVVAGAGEGLVMGVGQGLGEDSLDNIDVSTDRLVAHGASGALFGGGATLALSGAIGAGGAAVRRASGLLGRRGSRLGEAAANESKSAGQRVSEYLTEQARDQRVASSGATPTRLLEYHNLVAKRPEVASRVDDVLRSGADVDGGRMSPMSVAEVEQQATLLRNKSASAFDEIEYKSEDPRAWEYAPRLLGESPADEASYRQIDRLRKEYMAKANRPLLNDDLTKIATEEQLDVIRRDMGVLQAEKKAASKAGDKAAVEAADYRIERLKEVKRNVEFEHNTRDTTDKRIKLQQKEALEKFRKETMRDIERRSPDDILSRPTQEVGIYAKIRAIADKARRGPEVETGGSAAVRQIDNFADTMLDESGGAMTVKSMREWRKKADNAAEIWKDPRERTYMNKRFAEIRDMMEEEIEASQGRIEANLHPEDAGRYAAAKTDYAASEFILKTTKGVVEKRALQQTDRFKDAVAGAIGGVAGGLMFGPAGIPMAAIGLARPALKYALREKGGFLAADAMERGARAFRPREEAVRTIVAADADVERRVAKSVSAFMARDARAPTRVAVAGAGRAYMAYDRPTAQKKTDEIIKVARRVANDPKAAAEVIQQVAGPLATYAPKTYARAAMNYSNAFQVMVKNLPPPRYEIGTLTVPVSESYDNETVAKVLRMADAMENPVGVIERLPTGDVTLEELEVVEAVAPTVFQDVRKRMLEGLASGELNPGHREKVTLSLIFKTPADSSMTSESIRLSQLIYAQASDDDVGGPDGRAAPTQPRNTPSRPIEYASGMRTRSEVIESGGRVQ